MECRQNGKTGVRGVGSQETPDRTEILYRHPIRVQRFPSRPRASSAVPTFRPVVLLHPHCFLPLAQSPFPRVQCLFTSGQISPSTSRGGTAPSAQSPAGSRDGDRCRRRRGRIPRSVLRVEREGRVVGVFERVFVRARLERVRIEVVLRRVVRERV